MEDISLNEFEKDALKEIGNICSGSAATALSQLLQRKININVPKILFLSLEDVPQAIGGADKLVVGLILRVLGDLPGTMMFVFSQRDAFILSSLMTGKEINSGKIIGDMERSALKEIGVILANAYLGGLASFVGMSLVPTVPELIEDMAGAMVDYILIELSSSTSFALLIESEFLEPQ
ncbi:MAG: chemotaxis protein CheC, partial [Candidatus Omnitrophica bacterium]|nr:chemotaxis protein CheC [Candidatus Omnitrophota bacterium]